MRCWNNPKMNEITKSTKIVFFGTSDRSLPILNSLKDNFNLILCVTKSDTVVGRNKDTRETEVKKWATQNDIKFIAIDSLKGENLEHLINTFKKDKPDIGVVADFSFMIPKSIIDAFNGNLINVHFSLLPKYRGASPVQHAILNGDEYTGVTYYLLDENMDEGDILSQFEYKIDPDITSGELYSTLFKLSAQNLPKTIKNYLEGKVTPIKQDNSKATYTISKTNPKHTFIYKQDALIDWQQNAEKIHRAIRAYNPWPIAWTYLGDLETTQLIFESIKLKPNVNRNLKVKIFSTSINDEKLKINQLQVEGKNKSDWVSFVNGYCEKSK